MALLASTLASIALDPRLPHGWRHYLLGGALVGVAVSFAFAGAGLVTGMSTVYTSTWSWFSRKAHFQQERFVSSRAWRAALAVGLILGAALVTFLGAGGLSITAVPVWRLVAGGLLVGFGARLGNGCTSGHGICGLASFQLPSLVAVLTFLAAAMLTARVVAALGGG